MTCSVSTIVVKAPFHHIETIQLVNTTNQWTGFYINRSSHQRCSVKKGVLRNFAKFRGKYLCQSLFFNKVAGLPATVLKRRLWHRCFPVNFAKFVRTPFLTEHLWWLLLYFSKNLIITQALVPT